MTRRIDFIIAGVQKAGTTSLDAYLRQHPDICMARKTTVTSGLSAPAMCGHMSHSLCIATAGSAVTIPKLSPLAPRCFIT